VVAIVNSSAAPTHRMVVTPDIQRIEDLRGKRMGVFQVGDGNYVLLSKVLAKYGMNPERDVVWAGVGGGNFSGLVSALAAGAIDGTQIATGAISTTQLADNSITAAKLGPNAVMSSNIAGGQVTTSDLADDAVTSLKILDGSVDTQDLANNSVTGAKIKDGTLTAADIAAPDSGSGVLVGSANISPGTIAADTCVVNTATVAGMQGGDHVILNTPTNFPSGLTAEAAPGALNLLQVRVCNTSASPITDGGAYSFGYVVLR
jgi:hypothetical protein